MTNTKNDQPQLILGDSFSDHRGTVQFINGFNFPGVKRFYIVENKTVGEVRAWHGHKKERKYVFVIAGKAMIGAVKVDNWENPSKDLTVHTVILDAKIPTVYAIPHGYANGFQSLQKGTKVIFFSDSTLEDSKNDDFRFDDFYWDVWKKK